jgi:NADPH2 dehydrogenase
VTKLFSTLQLNGLTLKNRITMSPMCMYSCEKENGIITPFHFTHYISRAAGGTGLIMTEATAVQPEGRISSRDLGIWDERHVNGLKELNAQLHTYGTKTGIQLAHAGKKAKLDGTIYAPSPLAFDDASKQPAEMTEADIKETVEAFAKGAKRANKADFDIIELHGAHGYLINQFLSPLTNKRTDNYGGSRENRFRFLADIVEAVQTVWRDRPLFVRLSANEYKASGNTLDDIIYFSRRLKKLGTDLIDASSGGVVPASIIAYPGYQLKRCETIRQEAKIATGAVGLITSAAGGRNTAKHARRSGFYWTGIAEKPILGESGC